MSKEGTELKITAVGDVWEGGYRRMAVYDEPEFMELVKLIRDAEVGYVQMETHFLDDKNQVPYRPIGQPITVERHSADTIIAKDLRWMGFNICSTAMNHSNDFGFEGILSTNRVLDEAGFTHAGTGATLSEASLPGYMQTKKGAVAIISAYSPPFWSLMATDPTPLTPYMARPGINGIRVHWVVDPKTFEDMKELRERFAGPFSDIVSGHRPVEPWWIDHFGSDAIMIPGGPTYVIKGKKDGTYAYTQPRDQDLERNVRAVKGAAGMADWVIYALHDHTRDGLGFSPTDPSSSTKMVAHAVIDAGADVFFGSGGQAEMAYKGIEIYKGKPIFWTLGVWEESIENMWKEPYDVFEELRLPLNTDMSTLVDYMMRGRKGGYAYPFTKYKTWEEKHQAWNKDEKAFYYSCYLATMKLEGKQGPNRKVTEIKLYPCDQRGDLPRTQRGRPMRARGGLALKVLGRLKENSAKYGTEIEIDEKEYIGIVKL